MKLRVIVLGAGCGGLELSSILSEVMGDTLDLTLLDKNDAFYFGFSKFEVMFSRKSYDEVCIPYSHIHKNGVRFLQAEILAIDPISRCVTTDLGVFEADIIVVALGAAYDFSSTPGFTHGADEFYSLEGALRLKEKIPSFNKGRLIIGVMDEVFKCPPAPCEAALLMHDYLQKKGVRGDCEINVIIPCDLPVPNSHASSTAMLEAFNTRKINFIAGRRVKAIDGIHKVAILDNDERMHFELFLGIPKHIVPAVVSQSGLTEDGWIPVDPDTVMTRYPQVYAIGDVSHSTMPKAGVFAEEAARIAAESILSFHQQKNVQHPASSESGSCYIDFGEGNVARVDMHFRHAKSGSGKFVEPSVALEREKQLFRYTRVKRWFGEHVEINHPHGAPAP